MNILNQIAVIFGISLLGDAVSYVLPFTFPPQIVALLILFLLLYFKLLKVDDIKEDSDFLLKNMSFLFIPAGVGIIEEVKIFWPYIGRLLFIMISGNFVAFFFASFCCNIALKLTRKEKE